MKKIVKKIGNSEGITFSKEERETYNISAGCILDLEFVVIKPKKESK